MRILKRTAAAVTAVTLLTGLSSCGKQISKTDAASDTVFTNAEKTVTTAPESEAEEEVTTAEEKTPEVEEIEYKKFSKTIEAELGALSGKLKTAKKRKGFNGDGYVSSFKNEGDRVDLAFSLEKSQFYTVKVRAASDKGARLKLEINDTVRYITVDKDTFSEFLISNLYLEEGVLSISISPAEGQADVDRVTVEASDEVEKLDLTIKNAKLSNKNADEPAQALYQYICSVYGSQTLLGQYDSAGTDIETDAIYKLTGKYPAIRFGDLMSITGADTSIAENEIEKVSQWHENGGIVGLMWHWYAPDKKDEYYSEKTGFDLSKAVTKEDISELSALEIEKLVKKKKISKQCQQIVSDIDTVSEQLKTLKSQGIAVLWRPLHEASNGYFWWGKDEKSYKWLWKLMYDRMTKLHGLDNLIWVWSAQNSSWYVGDDYCDILSLDIYDQGNLDGQIDRLLFLRSINQQKPIAMSECGNFPSIGNMVREKAMWAYIGQWGGNFLLNADGELEESYNKKDDLIDIYNNEYTLTRDELPDLSKPAKAEEEKADEKKTDEKEKKSDDSSDKDKKAAESKKE